MSLLVLLHYYIIITSLLQIHFYNSLLPIITLLLRYYYVIITSLLRHYYIMITICNKLLPKLLPFVIAICNNDVIMT